MTDVPMPPLTAVFGPQQPIEAPGAFQVPADDRPDPVVQQVSHLYGAVERGINEAKFQAEHLPDGLREQVYEMLDELADHAYEEFRSLAYGEPMVRWVRESVSEGTGPGGKAYADEQWQDFDNDEQRAWALGNIAYHAGIKSLSEPDAVDDLVDEYTYAAYAGDPDEDKAYEVGQTLVKPFIEKHKSKIEASIRNKGKRPDFEELD